jgi:hypothetical protein
MFELNKSSMLQLQRYQNWKKNLPLGKKRHSSFSVLSSRLQANESEHDSAALEIQDRESDDRL